MKKINIRIYASLAFFIFITSLFVSGCGGGGGGSSPLALDDGRSNISMRLLMLNRTPNASYVSVPQNAVGSVNISVVSIKSGKEVANRTVDYAMAAFTFENQIPAGDTYSVVVTARLKERANDIYQSVWQGAGTVAVLNAEKAAKTPGANELTVALVFRTIEYIKLYPAKITFDPAMPVGEITVSTLIPRFRVSVLDQFGNVMTSENNLVSISIENGSFKDSVYSKNLMNGSVYFSDLAVATLIPDLSGYVKLKAAYGSLAGYSSPIKTAGVAIPDSAVAGYLNDEKTSAAAPSAGRSNAPMANKEIRFVCGNLRYSSFTDQNGFFRIDARAGSPGAAAYIEFAGPTGALVRLDTVLSPGQVKLAAIRIDASGIPRLVTSVLNIPYGSSLSADQLKKAVVEDIAAKAAFGGAAGISGVAVDASTGSPISSATVTLDMLGITVQTDPAGRFSITASSGQLAEGSYIVSFNRNGYLASSKTVGVSSLDYGFLIEAVRLEASPRQNAPPSVVIRSVSGSSQNIAIVFDLADPDGDACNIEVQYSLNGGYSYLATVNAGGALSGVSPGAGHNAVWFSSSDFLTKQSSVRVRLIPRDAASTGQAGESVIFAVDNEIVDPENNPPVIMGVMASGASGDITVSYDLIDQDGDSCAVELYYSLDGGATFTRSSSYSLYNQRAFPGTKLVLVWNSALDFQTEEKSVKLRLTPNDSKSGGTSGESNVFEVNNIKNTPPVIQSLSATGNYKDISLSYDLIELDGHLCTVEVYFSLDGGANFSPTAHLSGETSSVAAGTKSLVWHSFLDFAVTNKSVFVKLVPSDKYGYGTEAVFGPFEVNNAGGAPSITGLAVTGASQTIDIRYDLADLDASLSTVEVYFSLDGGASFKQTGYVEGDIHAVSPGAGKTIKWNSYGDFRTHEWNVVLKLSPIDSFGRGTEAVSLPLEINNNVNRPSISNVRTKGDSGEIQIAYDIDDIDGSTCHVMLQYSTENSAGFLMSSAVSGDTDEVYSGRDRILVWNSKADLSGNYDSVSVKLISSDDEGPGGEAVSQAFKVYNNATGEIVIASVSGGSQNITVNFSYSDPEGDPAAIEVYYSRDGGATFTNTYNLAGTTYVEAPGSAFSLIWESDKDIVNQNAAGVLLKLAAFDSSGRLQSEKVSQPFAVNNYVPPVILPLQMLSAEFVEGVDNVMGVKMTFNAQINPSSAVDLNNIKLKGISAYSGCDFEIDGNSVIVTHVNSVGYNNQDYVFGVTGDFVADRGLQILAGSGIKSTAGAEAQAHQAPVAISRMKGLTKVYYSNATGEFSVPVSASLMTYSMGHIDIYIGNTAPVSATTPLASSSDTTNHNFTISLGSTYPAGDHVYYRFVASIGPLVGDWLDFGAIPDPSAIFEASGQRNISWSNVRSELEVVSSAIGVAGDRILLYQYGDAIYSYVGKASPAPEGGYYPGAYSVTDSGGNPVTVAAGNTVVFTFTNVNGIESGYYNAGAGPSLPPAELSSSNINIKYNSNNYQLYVITTAVALSDDVVVYSPSNQKLGRIAAGNYPPGSFITSYLDTANPSSLELFSGSGPLKFVSVDSGGNESDARTGPAVTVLNPNDIRWSNAGASSSFKLSAAYGSGNVSIQAYSKSPVSYTPLGSAVSQTSGFIAGIYSVGPKVTAGDSIAYKYTNESGNESPITDDGVVPPPPDAAVTGGLRLAYNGPNYEVKNTGAGVMLDYNLGVYVDSSGLIRLGVINIYVAGYLEAGSFPAAGAYFESSKAPNSLDDGLSPSGGSLAFTYVTDSGNESDVFYNSSSVPPSPAGLSAATVKYDPAMVYRIFANQASINIASGTRIYAGGETVLSSASGEAIAANGWSTAALAPATSTAGGSLGFTQFADGNESAKFNAGMVPGRPDRAAIKWRNGYSRFRALAAMGTNQEKLRLYQKDGAAYAAKGDADNPGPYAAYVEYQVTGGTPPLITGGKEAAYTLVDVNSGNESALSESGVVPATPLAANMLRTAYTEQMDYVLKNTATSDNFILPDGVRLDVYIGGSLAGSRSAEGSPVTIPADGGVSDFTLTPGGGQLNLIFTSIASGNEAVQFDATYVSAAPSYGFPIIVPGDNGSNNTGDFINLVLAGSVINAPSADNQKLAVNFNSSVGNGNIMMLRLTNPVSGRAAELSCPIAGIGFQSGEFTLLTAGPLDIALGADGGPMGTGLDSSLWIVNSDGNASATAMASGTVRYDITPPVPSSIIATLATDGVFTHNGTDKLEITFAENILFNTTPGINDIFFAVTGDGFGGVGSSFNTTATMITVISPNEGGANSGVLKKDGFYDGNTAPGSSSGIYFAPNQIKDDAGNFLIVPVNAGTAMDVQ